MELITINGNERQWTHAASGDRLEAFLQRVCDETGLPGIALAASVGGKRFSVSAGTTAIDGAPLTAGHRFHVGCTTKLLLAIAALELFAEGQLDIAAPLAAYVPELEGTPLGLSVTVLHLLSHTSGYRGLNIFDAETRSLTWSSLIDYLRDTPQLFEPGTVFSYEHTESVLLGRIIERATQRDCLHVVRERLLDPLGIEPGRLESYRDDSRYAGRNEYDLASGRFVAVRDAPSMPAIWDAAFSDYTLSPMDLVRVGESLVSGIGHEAGSLLSERTPIRLMQRVVTLPAAVGGPLTERLPVAFGLGAAELRDGTYGHNGLTYGQCLALRVDRPTGAVVAIALNATLPHVRDCVLSAVCTELTGRRNEDEAPVLPFELADLEGLYVGPGRSVVHARLDAGRLRLDIAPNGGERALTAELTTDAEGHASLRSPIAQLSVAFFREPQGVGSGLMLGLNAYKRIAARRPSRARVCARRVR